MTIFTICSNNYLAQAIVLGNSVKEHNPNYNFLIFLCDKKDLRINYEDISHEIIELEIVEPNITELAKKYNIIELNTAVKPTVFKYLFKKGIEKAIYLDPDIYVFQSLAILSNDLDKYSILLTPHILSPINWDNKTPTEHSFLNYGTYNLGFIGLRNDKNADEFLDWWKSHTYNSGYIKPQHGIFVDQLPINLVPIFFNGVEVYNHPGLNMAPWNLHERELSIVNNEIKVNKSHSLIFYHFSSHKFNKIELPEHYYNRYTLKQRVDLTKIVSLYDRKLLEAEFKKFCGVKSVYSEVHENELLRLKKELWKETSNAKKIFLFIKKLIPAGMKARLR